MSKGDPKTSTRKIHRPKINKSNKRGGTKKKQIKSKRRRKHTKKMRKSRKNRKSRKGGGPGNNSNKAIIDKAIIDKFKKDDTVKELYVLNIHKNPCNESGSLCEVVGRYTTIDESAETIEHMRKVKCANKKYICHKLVPVSEGEQFSNILRTIIKDANNFDENDYNNIKDGLRNKDIKLDKITSDHGINIIYKPDNGTDEDKIVYFFSIKKLK